MILLESGKGTDMEEKTEAMTIENPAEEVCNTDAKEQAECCHCRTKHRATKEYKELMNRLKRIEGQVRGIQGMLEEERYCVDILTQVMAVQSALNSFNKMLLANHIKTCVVEDIQNGQEDAVDELCTTIQRLMK